VLVNPADWCSFGTYAANVDDKVYKEFDLSDVSGADAATVEYLALVDTEINFDYFRTAYKNDGGDPFTGGTQLQASSGSNYYDTEPNWNPAIPWVFQHDLAGCLTANCSIGFQLESDDSEEYEGIGVLNYLIIDALELGANKYRLLNGTSMATPHVTGIAALVRAYNPDYTYADTVAAIKQGGENVKALATRTSTGKAANAMGSLSYINPPTGVAVGLQ
jgi:subtilisin family serine protease